MATFSKTGIDKGLMNDPSNTMSQRKRIPCHVIAGTLGVGKTKTILKLLKHRGEQEHIAVVLNDFGQAGLDAEIVRVENRCKPDSLIVKNVPGGCLCCSSVLDLENTLAELMQMVGITRILIEPSGLVSEPIMRSQLESASACPC